MKSPTMKLNGYKVKYKQVPYDERYFFIYYRDKEIAKIPYHLYNIKGIPGNWLLDGYSPKAEYDHYDRFMDRVEAYNKYLDNF